VTAQLLCCARPECKKGSGKDSKANSAHILWCAGATAGSINA
jgi:hypothetical protein